MANDRVMPTRENACRALVGNLCRCTGYDAILRAAVETDHASVQPLDEMYASSEMEAALRAAVEEDVLLETPTHRIYKPATLAQALQFRAHTPHATIVAGGTDWGVLINKRVREISSVLALYDVRELREIAVSEDSIRVGATATLSELERVATEALPPLGEFLSWFGSPPIKNAGTLAGNLATGSPIGDSLPALMVLGASVELASGGANPQRRHVKLTDFYTGYRQTVLRPDELIVAIHVPRLRDDETLKLYKVSKRKDLDISSVSAAIFLRLDGEVIADARIALGGVGPTVTRHAAAEDALRGAKTWMLDAFERAAHIIRESVKPISDVRGSADYRRAVAGNLLLKCFHEVHAAPVGGGAR
jgi:xanthine dehydrogenase small subunit